MKPGYKTTEFWLTLAATIMALFNQSGAFGFTVPAETIMPIFTGVAAYVVSRSGTKAMAAYLKAKSEPVDPVKLND